MLIDTGHFFPHIGLYSLRFDSCPTCLRVCLSAMECILKVLVQVTFFESVQCNYTLHSLTSFSHNFSPFFFLLYCSFHLLLLFWPSLGLRARTDSEGHTLIVHDTSAMELTFLKYATSVCVLWGY